MKKAEEPQEEINIKILEKHESDSEVEIDEEEEEKEEEGDEVSKLKNEIASLKDSIREL